MSLTPEVIQDIISRYEVNKLTVGSMAYYAGHSESFVSAVARVLVMAEPPGGLPTPELTPLVLRLLQACEDYEPQICSRWGSVCPECEGCSPFDAFKPDIDRDG